MGRASYKQKCILCKKNHALVTWKNRTPICVECKMKEINKPIDDPKFKKLFDIPSELYEQSSFLRNIKSNYLHFGSLSEKQVEMFKKVAEEVKNKKPEPKKMKDIPEATEADL
jgi:hypothetical protein